MINHTGLRRVSIRARSNTSLTSRPTVDRSSSPTGSGTAGVTVIGRLAVISGRLVPQGPSGQGEEHVVQRRSLDGDALQDDAGGIQVVQQAHGVPFRLG